MGSHRDRGPQNAKRSRPWWTIPVVALVGIVLGTTLVTWMTWGIDQEAAQTVAAVDEVPQVYFGRVVAVQTPQDVLVATPGHLQRIRVLGMDAPQGAECGADRARTYAIGALLNEMVTLVPDPTVALREPDGRLRSYVVLSDQLSYTDDAIRRGYARQATDLALWYAPVFKIEETQTKAHEIGLWGSCWR